MLLSSSSFKHDVSVKAETATKRHKPKSLSFLIIYYFVCIYLLLNAKIEIILHRNNNYFLFLFPHDLIRILDSSVVDGFKTLNEDLLGDSNVVEGNLALTEQSVLDLLVNELVDKF